MPIRHSRSRYEQYWRWLVAAVICHEVSHGVVANWFGDDTAKRAGRLTLNPVPHIDPFGSINLSTEGLWLVDRKPATRNCCA